MTMIGQSQKGLNKSFMGFSWALKGSHMPDIIYF